MKKQTALAILMMACGLIFPGCSNDNADDGDYRGVGKLVAERNKARKAIAGSKKDSSSSEEAEYESLNKKPREMLFEEEVTIISISSGKTLATATAYLDKSGKNINIRIRRN